MKTIQFSLFTCLILLLCCGCQMLTPTAAKQDDLDAKQFRPDDEKSYIYVVWPFGLVGGGIALETNVNGKILGEISRGKYFLVVTEPREINFVATLPVDAFSPGPRITYFSCQAGQCKYLEGSIQMGASMLFKELDNEKGEKIIKSSSLIEKIVLE